MGDVPFTPGKPQFDQANWLGRCRHFFAITNPAYLFATEEQLASAKAKLEGFKAGTLPPGTSNQELWKAQTLCDAVLHPDTKMPVPAMFRVCAFAPANIPICAGMLMTPPTIFNVVFWQWVNQSYNAGFNYCNRNASSSMDNTKLAQVYFGATTVSVGTAVGMAQALKAAPLSAAMAAFLGRIVPYTAVATSNVFNVSMMRSGELTSGIPVKDADGNVRGISKEAAKSAVTQAAITRAVMPAPVLLLPPVVMQALDRVVRIPVRARGSVEFAVIIGCVAGALPAAIALFPQEASIPVDKLEPEFRNLTTNDNAPVRFLTCNKGV